MNDEIEIERKEQYQPPSQGNPKNFLAEKRNLILIGAGVLIVVLLFFFFRFSGKDKSTETLVQMEQKLAVVEQKIAALEKRQEDLASGPVKSLAEKVEMLEKRLTEKPKLPVSPKAKAAPPAKRYHKMKKGETLTGIAKKYGLSVEELQRMNKLSPKTTTTAGQRLIVGPGGKK
jgi:LysM repeat protein